VFGHSDFDVEALTSDFDVRNGLNDEDFDEHYMVLGLFGDDQNDEGLLPGTRWVARSELEEFCDSTSLQLLVTWEMGFSRRMEARRRPAPALSPEQ